MKQTILKWSGLVAILITLISFVYFKHKTDNPVIVQGEGLAGGITRVAVGTQTKWTTDLIPSSSFTVNLGSSALPVNQLFFTRASGSFGEFTGYASASAYTGTALPATNCNGTSFLQWATTGLFGCGTPAGNSYTGLAVHEGSATAFHVTDFKVDAGGFNFSNTASNGFLFIDYANGPASRSISQTITGQWAFNSSPLGLTVANSASISLNFEVGGYASASFFKGTAFPATNCTSNNALQWSTTGLFSCSSNAFAVLGVNTFTGLQTFNASPLGFTVANSASVSANFEVGGYASVSGPFTQNKLSSNSFNGSIEPKTSGIGSLGTTALKWAQAVVNLIQAVVQFVFPTTTSTSNTIATSTAGSAVVNTASGSLDFSDGSTQFILQPKICFTYVADSPTSSNPSWVGEKRFDDPFTITKVQEVASGSNSAGWNLYYGAPGSQTTAVFTVNKSASTSTYPTYSGSLINNSTILDNNVLSLVISSRSAVLQTFSVNVCGRWNK